MQGLLVLLASLCLVATAPARAQSVELAALQTRSHKGWILWQKERSFCVLNGDVIHLFKSEVSGVLDMVGAHTHTHEPLSASACLLAFWQKMLASAQHTINLTPGCSCSPSTSRSVGKRTRTSSRTTSAKIEPL